MPSVATHAVDVVFVLVEVDKVVVVVVDALVIVVSGEVLDEELVAREIVVDAADTVEPWVIVEAREDFEALVVALALFTGMPELTTVPIKLLVALTLFTGIPELTTVTLELLVALALFTGMLELMTVAIELLVALALFTGMPELTVVVIKTLVALALFTGEPELTTVTLGLPTALVELREIDAADEVLVITVGALEVAMVELPNISDAVFARTVDDGIVWNIVVLGELEEAGGVSKLDPAAVIELELVARIAVELDDIAVDEVVMAWLGGQVAIAPEDPYWYMFNRFGPPQVSALFPLHSMLQVV